MVWTENCDSSQELAKLISGKSRLNGELSQFGELGMQQLWICFESHANPHFWTAMGQLFD